MPDACLNCGAPFASRQKFCGACGQRTDVTSQLSMQEVGHDLMHAITHADRSVFSLVRALLTRPGHVAADYAAGRRKRFFGPFAFLLIMVGLASAVILMADVQWFSPYRHGRAGDILQRHVNLVILLQTPLLAAFSALLFRADRRNFAEHLVLAAYASGFHALFLALVETPVLALTHADTSKPALAAGYFGIWFAYFAFAGSQFYRGNRAWAALRAFVAAMLSQAVTIILAMSFLYLATLVA